VRVTVSDTCSANEPNTAIVGDACLLTVAAFCGLAVFGPLLVLALIIGPVMVTHAIYARSAKRSGIAATAAGR
jgi:hypothetical protein